MLSQYIFFSVSEALTNIWRMRVLNLLSVGTIGLATFTLGAFLLIGINLKHASVGWTEELQFHVFLLDSASLEQTKAIERRLTQDPAVTTCRFLSKNEAQRKFEDSFKTYGDVQASLDQNPFPASFRVALGQDTAEEHFEHLRDDLVGLPGVEEVFFDSEVHERLSFFAHLIQMVGWVFTAIIVFASVFTISNVLKLTFFARKEEIDIMKLVGASRAFIRGPFIVEGIFQGGLGSVMGLLVLLSCYYGLRTYLDYNPDTLLASIQLTFLPSFWCSALLIVGCLSGFVGAILSLNQFLEEHIAYH